MIGETLVAEREAPRAGERSVADAGEHRYAVPGFPRVAAVVERDGRPISRHDVDDAVAVEIARDDLRRTVENGVFGRRAERSVSVSGKDEHLAVALTEDLIGAACGQEEIR